MGSWSCLLNVSVCLRCTGGSWEYSYAAICLRCMCMLRCSNSLISRVLTLTSVLRVNSFDSHLGVGSASAAVKDWFYHLFSRPITRPMGLTSCSLRYVDFSYSYLKSILILWHLLMHLVFDWINYWENFILHIVIEWKAYDVTVKFWQIIYTLYQILVPVWSYRLNPAAWR